MTTTQVLLPDGKIGPFPVLYLLHGLSDDASTWIRRSRIEVYVKDLPLVVVMPDGYRGFYTNNADGPAYARHIGEELPGLIERTFAVKAERSARAIGGLSMGGYGALRLGLGYADRYCSIHSHSGAVGWNAKGGLRAMARRREWSPEFTAELTRIFGRSPVGGPNDLVALATKAKRARLLPEIALDCGTEDYLLADNRDFVQRLTTAKIPFAYQEHPGAHDWDYWDLHIREALRFHARNLRIAV
jgi:S-formylglutathione hydrolase FrmB